MGEFEAEVQRLRYIDRTVRQYLLSLREYEQGLTNDDTMAVFWRDQLDALTSDAIYQTVGGDKFDKYGNQLEGK